MMDRIEMLVVGVLYRRRVFMEGHACNKNKFVICCPSACLEDLVFFALKGLLSVSSGHYVGTY
jgi:hypothetical protein